ncbi:uncharacterized protein OCT59_019412 [Rhizophagus irregularis]|nr:hypothetical protein GLOIN_2v1660145 [Rhizophagus irregularis DAOM 181602=DAOM 197198]EXX76359.1 hypothetical protein RirG_033870 [Rhizophagus irregularis DAOM 197198w]POG66079.1 hypothetical protein GLOIN_2v1660145 [Rhizophagus irregularis DAOM 181602=DAOM 197198]UZO27207.1 hypothetical protein OCT59_019412 [Rhizophagus irregularis]CAG8694768.1 21629_t:CDS:2 [Rhizophagus irregularis]|eukprot:XP_025172945.1 hypothetical protein GLOIN_2v1660145 [Rhizophagus irregularis DAOM 181602=DAOM 197198]
MPISSQEYMYHEGHIDDNEVAVSRYEGEDNDENYEDDLYVSPSNFESIIKDPYLLAFFRELCENRSYGSPVSSFERTCYFNGANSFAIPNRGDYIQPASQNIAHILELWLTEKLSNIGETIPILEEYPQISAESIMTKLKETVSSLNGLEKVLINIRAGHVYLLHMIGDVVVMDQNCERFFQQFPLFVNVSIKVQEHSPSVRHNTCQVLVAVEHVTMKGENRNIPLSCRFSHQQHQSFDGAFTNTRVASSPDGQTFCLLEELATR